MIRIALSAAALLLTATTVSAQTATKTAPATVRVGNWLVGPLDATSCQMETHFGDHLLVNISEEATGVGHFIFGDDRWLLKDGDLKPATWSWDGWKTSSKGNFHALKAGLNFYLVMETDAGFTENMAGAKQLWLRIPGVGFDDDFAIPETKELIGALQACNQKL